jgi:signal transduction histidine kinase
MYNFRLVAAIAPITVALALLGLLLLVSTQPGDAAARRLDIALRQASELAPRISSLSSGVLSGSAQVDPVGALEQLETALDRRLEVAIDAFEELNPRDLDALQRGRAIAQALFDAIEVEDEEQADRRAQFADVSADAEMFATRAEGVRVTFERWRELDREVVADSRALVADLRARGENATADLIFGTTEQLRDRLSGPTPASVVEIGEIIDALRGTSVSEVDRSRFDILISRMRDLGPARRSLVGAVEALGAHPLPSRVAQLRDDVAGDLVARLSTIGDARTLLNIYTALLLAVLVYFAIRLRGSYAELNRSYEVLEVRVQERTKDLVKANEDLKESQVQLVQAEKMSSLGQLVAGIMHEINTPLMYVRSNVETTADSTTRLGEDVAPAIALATELREQTPDRDAVNQKLSAIRRNLDPAEVDISLEEIATLSADTLEGLDQISELVQSLKDFSRLDRADEDWFDVREGLDRTLTITRNLLKYGIEVVKNFEEVPQIRCAPSRLNQVFINLVTNAVQAMDGKGRLELATRHLGDEVEVSITDTGCGIPEEHLAKIMDPFFTTKPVGEGTGLGMSIVRTIVEEHGGRLDVSSVVGVGTTMTVTLPLKKVVAAQGPDVEAA